MSQYTKDELRKLASSEILEVKFTKTDGTERIMKCTLIPRFLPPQRNDFVPSASHNENILAVWDVDLNEWRSFRVKSVISVNTLDLMD